MTDKKSEGGQVVTIVPRGEDREVVVIADDFRAALAALDALPKAEVKGRKIALTALKVGRMAKPADRLATAFQSAAKKAGAAWWAVPNFDVGEWRFCAKPGDRNGKPASIKFTDWGREAPAAEALPAKAAAPVAAPRQRIAVETPTLLPNAVTLTVDLEGETDAVTRELDEQGSQVTDVRDKVVLCVWKNNGWPEEVERKALAEALVRKAGAKVVLRSKKGQNLVMASNNGLALDSIWTPPPLDAHLPQEVVPAEEETKVGGERITTVAGSSELTIGAPAQSPPPTNDSADDDGPVLGVSGAG